MTLEASRAVADKLFAAHNSRTPIPPVREMLPADAIDLAYAAQEINTERRLKEGRRLVGRKIGLTSLAVQRQLGVDQPDYGMLFHDMAVPDGWDVAADQLIQPKVEAEIAFVIGRDLDNEHLTIADILRAVEFALPAIEIVDSRIATGRSAFSTRSPTTPPPASMFSAHQPKKLDGLELRLCRHGDGAWAARRSRSASARPALAIRCRRRSGSPRPWRRSDGR